ncbi:uncharacterized protein LOC133640120 [Entelurus aequoreus]|uniref:uncharacterized protein LOC133640120 n=1 Tax=Entelurus aequoreus TaxID=161455 RepID=UPI002B1E19B5|nr:uncharacterized protein LOC133640120 [Entelurus aequoreus]
MVFTPAPLLHLVLVSVVSASHHFGGLTTYNYGGKNSDGTFIVTIRNRATFDGCYNSQFINCYHGICGNEVSRNRSILDHSSNAPIYNSQWCEAETVITRHLPFDKPFSLRSASCCWIPNRNSLGNWRQLTTVDLGIRSDTGVPNTSPAIGTLPFLRVPQNCPRTYKLMAFDPDGDQVRCRYGKLFNTECSSCRQPVGFQLDEDTCTLHYNYMYTDSRVFGFELVVEDFPQQPITLVYSDGSHSFRPSLAVRRKREVTPFGHWATPQSITRSTLHPWYISTRNLKPKTPHPWGSWSTATQHPWGRRSTTTPHPWGHRSTTTPHPWGHRSTTTPHPWGRRSTTTPHPWGSWSTTTPHPWGSWPATTPNPWGRRSTPTSHPWRGWYTTKPRPWGHMSTTTPNPWGSWPTTTPHPWRTWPATTPHPWRTWPTTTPYPWRTWPTTTPHPWRTWPATTPHPWRTWPTTTPHPWRTWPATTPHPWRTWPATTRNSWGGWPTTILHTTAHRATTRHINATSIPPIGKLPLQFSLLVDPPVPSCQEGLYLPKFVYPTPQNGESIHAEVNKEVEIRVKALASYATIYDIITSGPVNTNKYRTTHDEFAIRWTPRPGDMGGHYPLCFAVESIRQSAHTTTTSSYDSYYHHYSTPLQSSVYQSEMRCVLLDVRNETIKATVTCAESNMTVAIRKASLRRIHLDQLQLSDSSNVECNLQRHSNSTHVVAVIPLNSCGTQLEEDDENLIFRNEITTVDNLQDTITRKNRLQLDFCCQYPKRGNVTQSFSAHRNNTTVWEKGFGVFTYQFEFYANLGFQTMISPTFYPLEYELGSRIYMKIEASTAINNTELFVESCRAAPYDNPNYHPTYTILDNGCKVDSTLQIHASHEREFRFSIEAFKFIGLYDQVYISCSVLVCEAGAPNTRCSKGCINSTGTAEGHHHKKREAVIQSANHFVSQGPLRLKRSADSDGSRVLNLNLNLVFIAGCLLAVIGMISTVVVYKAKMSRIKYQRLPTFET